MRVERTSHRNSVSTSAQQERAAFDLSHFSMAVAVAPQVDVGSLSLHGLSSSSAFLATVSADNIAPSALLQLQDLGSLFRISGKHAEKVPGLLQRFSSVRLDKLALQIGWHKGDCTSIMARTPGGQAIALLSHTLGAIYQNDVLGDILKGLSHKLVPTKALLASTEQLVKIARTLQQKTAILGFGNILAKQVLQIDAAYKALGKHTPGNLLELISGDAMIDLLEQVLYALCDESTVIRISGSYAAAYILSLLLAMFPQDTLVTLDQIVLVEGTHKPPSIIIELRDEPELPAATHLEAYVEQANGLRLPFALSNEPLEGPSS